MISIDTKFTDAFERDGVVYFTPFNADSVGALDIETEHFRLLDISKTISRDFKPLVIGVRFFFGGGVWGGGLGGGGVV